jgi:phasin
MMLDQVLCHDHIYPHSGCDPALFKLRNSRRSHRVPTLAWLRNLRLSDCDLPKSQFETNNMTSEERLMDTNTKTAAAGSAEAKQQVRAMTEQGAKQSKEAFEKAGAATTEATEVMANCFSTAMKGAQDYNSKLVEFTQANIKSAFEFVQSLAGVKSPTEFVQVSTEHARRQIEEMAEQTKQLAAITQRVTLTTAEPLKSGFFKGFERAA